MSLSFRFFALSLLSLSLLATSLHTHTHTHTCMHAHVHTYTHCTPALLLQAAMVHYEVALILRAVGRQELYAALKGVCTTLLQNGAVLRNLENLGEKELPYKMSAHKGRFTHGRYAIVSCPARSMQKVRRGLDKHVHV